MAGRGGPVDDAPQPAKAAATHRETTEMTGRFNGS